MVGGERPFFSRTSTKTRNAERADDQAATIFRQRVSLLAREAENGADIAALSEIEEQLTRLLGELQ
jgi:hypothetical protein